MTKMRILFLGGNYFPEPTGIGKYAGEMMDWLSSQGHECAVIATYPYYPYWKVQQPYAKKSFWYSQEERIIKSGKPIKVYRCPHYVPEKPTGLKRVVSDLSYFFSAFFQMFLLLFAKKYDFVITGVPPFQLGLLGILYKWVKGSPFIYHIYDLQVDAARDLGMIKSKWLLNIMFALEKFIIKNADYVSSVSLGMIRKIEAKCNKPVIFFPNWVDIKSFYPILFKEDLKKNFNFSTADKIILYSGAIGEKQGLEVILQIAKNFDRSNVKFVICGSGPYKETLISKASEMKLENVLFLPLVSKEKFNEFLNIADVHLVLQKANADDLVMPSKLTTILSVGGLALVTSTKGSSLHSIVTDHKMGIVIEPENKVILEQAIGHAIDLTDETLKLNARLFAEEYLSIDKVMARFFGEVLSSKKSTKVKFKIMMPLATKSRKKSAPVDVVN